MENSLGNSEGLSASWPPRSSRCLSAGIPYCNSGCSAVLEIMSDSSDDESRVEKRMAIHIDSDGLTAQKNSDAAEGVSGVHGISQ